MKKVRGRTRPFTKFIYFLLLAIAVLGCVYWFCCLSRPGKSKGLSSKDESSLRVATLNINAFRFLKTPDEAVEYLLSAAENYDVDIMFLQEYFHSKWFSDAAFKSLVRKEYKYVLTDGEQAVISRYPILEYDFTSFPGSNNSFVTSLIDVGGDPVVMISAHLQTTGYNAVNDDDRTSLALRYVLKANEEARVSQALKLRSEIEQSEYPVVVVGDFNSLPYSKVYRIVKKNSLKDTYLEKGRGSGATYRMLHDLLRIDYILHDNNFKCLDNFICEDYISDHRMVISTLERL